MAEKKGGKKPASPDDIMAPAELKAILAQARRGNPASCAIGLTKDKDGVILLDKRRKPKQLLAELKKQAAGAGLELDGPSLRFGRAMVDTDTDAGLLTLSINKDAPAAMRPKLLEHIKKAGFAKLELVVESGLETESEQDDQPAAPPPAAAPQAAAAQAPPAPQTAAPTAAAATVPDAATLTRTLTELVRRMIPVIGATPDLGALLKPLATQAQASLKAGDLPSAAGGIEELRRELDRAGPPAPQAAAPQAAAPQAAAPAPAGAPAKSRLVWLATRQKVESDLARLKAGIMAACNGQDIEAALEDSFRSKVEPLLDSLDDSLAHKLDAVNKATDPAQRAQLLAEAKQIVQRYQSVVAQQPIIAQLDANPFVPLSIQKTLTATLSALSASLR